MNKTDKWIDATYKELERKIRQQEQLFLDIFIEELADELEYDSNGINPLTNYTIMTKINDRFDEAYITFITPFLIWYANKLLEAGDLSLEYFQSIGEDATKKDTAYLAGMIGLVGGSIRKGSFLANLGMMGELRQQLQDTVMKAVVSGQKFNQLLRNVKTVFKSSKNQPSLLSKYYLKYAFQPVMQVLNATSYKMAKQFGLTHFLYAGDIIEKSRSFCIHRTGNVYSIEEGQSWNNIEWKGKIQGVDFFVQVGGTNCKHYLQYQRKEDINTQ